MAARLRCKSCGFITDESRLGEACPVCGVPRKMFEPFTDPVSARRRFVLELDIHPIIVHFSVSFAAFAFLVSIFVLAFPLVLSQSATDVLRALVAVLPLAVIASYFSGKADARTRYRKARSFYLRRKTLVGILFFALSVAAALLLFIAGPNPLWVRIADAALLAGCFACAFHQGRIGGHLLCTLFPG